MGLANARKVLPHMRQCPRGQLFTSERRVIAAHHQQRGCNKRNEKEEVRAEYVIVCLESQARFFGADLDIKMILFTA